MAAQYAVLATAGETRGRLVRGNPRLVFDAVSRIVARDGVQQAVDTLVVTARTGWSSLDELTPHKDADSLTGVVEGYGTFRRPAARQNAWESAPYEYPVIIIDPKSGTVSRK